jgi:hypothetical protein
MRTPPADSGDMEVFFCTACEGGLLFGDRRCAHCGVLAGSPQSLQLPDMAAPTRLARIGAFFASQAGLSLATLLIFLGLGIGLVPLGWNYAHLQQAHAPVPGLGAAPGADLPVKCSGLKVFFAQMATVGEVMTLLGKLDNQGTGQVSGPDPGRAFHLAAPAQVLPAVAASLGQAEDTVACVFVEPRCAAS